MEFFTVAGLTAVLGRLLPEPHAGLLAGILFGTKASLGRELTDAFITTGTIHLIALSGQNVSIIAALVAVLLTPFFSRRIASLLTILVLALYLWFVGPSASLTRAVIMGSLALGAVIFGKRNTSLLSLFLAVSIMLLLNLRWIADLGFQLSVLATLGIILFGGRGKGILLSELRITLAAQLLTIPLIVFHFHRLSLVAPVANVAIGWTMPYLMGFGWAAAVAGYLWLPLGFLPAWVCWVMLTYILRIVESAASFPFAGIGW